MEAASELHPLDPRLRCCKPGGEESPALSRKPWLKNDRNGAAIREIIREITTRWWGWSREHVKANARLVACPGHSRESATLFAQRRGVKKRFNAEFAEDAEFTREKNGNLQL